jgi:hypothetical protein
MPRSRVKNSLEALHLCDTNLQPNPTATNLECALLQAAEILKPTTLRIVSAHGCSLVDPKEKIEPQAADDGLFGFEFV